MTSDVLGELIEHLIVLADARGMRIDLGRPKQQQVPFAHRHPPRRRAVGEKGPTDLGIPGVLSAEGRQSDVRRQARWTASDLAHAAAAMPKDYWAALRWCLAEDQKARHRLKVRLLEHALELKEEHGWPEEVKRGECGKCGLMLSRRKYAQDLVAMALMEGACPRAFQSERDRARWFSLSETHWRRMMMVPYHLVFGELANWYICAWTYIARRLWKRHEDRAQRGTANQSVIANGGR